MAAKGTPLTIPTARSVEPEDLVFLAVPSALYRKLSDEAAKRQLTLAQFLAGAVSEALEKPAPQLLTEVK